MFSKQKNRENMINKTEFKPAFIERYSKLTDFEKFKEFSLKNIRKAIRVNTLKITPERLKAKIEKDYDLKLRPIPWCREGFWAEGERTDLGNLKEHILGYFYIQEAASMLPPIVLDPKPGDIVLDYCAAPGSKTTQLAQHMENRGIIIANDMDHKRLAALGANLQRCGVLNAVMTNMEGNRFDLGEAFDKILIDAPCSATGTIRKSYMAMNMWSPMLVDRVCATQRMLIKKAFEMLKPGGTMVYSTCSCEPEENEGMVSYLLRKFENAVVDEIDMKKELPGLKKADPILEFDGNEYNKEAGKTLRIWPQDNDTEGFFVARIKKI